MRTTLDLDDMVMEGLAARFPGVPRTEAVERALKAYLQQDAVAQLLAAAGTFHDLEDVSREMRESDRPW